MSLKYVLKIVSSLKNSSTPTKITSTPVRISTSGISPRTLRRNRVTGTTAIPVMRNGTPSPSE